MFFIFILCSPNSLFFCLFFLSFIFFHSIVHIVFIRRFSERVFFSHFFFFGSCALMCPAADTHEVEMVMCSVVQQGDS